MTPFSFITHRRGPRVWVHVVRKADSGLLETVHTSWSLTKKGAQRKGEEQKHRLTREWRRKQAYDEVYGLRGAA